MSNTFAGMSLSTSYFRMPVTTWEKRDSSIRPCFKYILLFLLDNRWLIFRVRSQNNLGVWTCSRCYFSLRDFRLSAISCSLLYRLQLLTFKFLLMQIVVVYGTLLVLRLNMLMMWIKVDVATADSSSKIVIMIQNRQVHTKLLSLE